MKIDYSDLRAYAKKSFVAKIGKYTSSPDILKKIELAASQRDLAFARIHELSKTLKSAGVVISFSECSISTPALLLSRSICLVPSVRCDSLYLLNNRNELLVTFGSMVSLDAVDRNIAHIVSGLGSIDILRFEGILEDTFDWKKVIDAVVSMIEQSMLRSGEFSPLSV